MFDCTYTVFIIFLSTDQSVTYEKFLKTDSCT